MPKAPRRSEQYPWKRIDAGPDAIEIQPSVTQRGVNVRVVSPDGEVSLREDEARRLIEEISAALVR